jgi:hypothetical protein
LYGAGRVRDITWHYERGAPMYFIEVAGKSVPRRKVSRRYFDADLEADAKRAENGIEK